MKNIIVTVFLSVFGLAIFGGLIFYSFFTKDENARVSIGSDKIMIGEYIYEPSESGDIIKRKINFIDFQGVKTTNLGETLPVEEPLNQEVEIDINGDIIFENNIDMYSTIYSDGVDYSVKINDDSIDIVLGEGSFLFDFKNKDKQVTIQSDIYNVISRDGGLFYVYSSKEKATVSSLNTVLTLDFFNGSTKELNFKTYLYPHMYLEFKKSRFILRKDLDSLRVSQLGELGYFHEKLVDLISQESIKFLSTNEEKIFFDSSIGLILDKYNLYTQRFIENKKIELGTLPGEGYLSKYFQFFYNKNKKSIYYKNIIFKDTIALLSAKKINIELSKKISDNLDILEGLSTNDFNEMKRFIEELYIYSEAYLDVNDSNYFAKLNLKSVINVTNNANEGIKNLDIMYELDKYNYISGASLYNFLFENYSDKDLIGETDLQFDYYEYYINNVILTGFANTNDTVLIDELARLLETRTESYSSIQNNRVDDEQIIELNIKNEYILTEVDVMLNRVFFEGRDDAGLLIRSTKDLQTLQLLEKSIFKIEMFFQNTRNIFENNGKYKYLLFDYEKRLVNFPEYFSALGNYSVYQKDYSEVNQKLLTTQVYENEKEVISEDVFKKYFSNFDGINLQSLDLSIINDLYYDVNSITIGGKDFAFELFPYEDNRIENIELLNSDFGIQTKEYVFYSELGNIALDLDLEEEKYTTLQSKAKDEDRDKYNFKMIFLNKLFPQDEIKEETYNDDYYDDLQQEDEVIAVFKSAKLLGNKGEFQYLDGVLDVKYNDLLVEKVGENFNISISSSLISFSIPDGNRFVKVYGDMKASYKLDEQNHYFFDVVIRPYTKENTAPKNYYVGESSINIKGNIQLLEFNDKMKTMLGKMDILKADYNNFQKSNATGDISIEYDMDTEEFSITENQ